MWHAKRFQLGRTAIIATCAFMLPSLFAGSTFAQDIVAGSSDKGAKLADRLCSNCHVSDDTTRNPVPAGVPTFRGIANKPGQTGMHIVGVLMAPHPPMPNINLSREEIGDIVAYIQTFRTDQTLPPLLPAPKEGTPKPKFPAPT